MEQQAQLIYFGNQEVGCRCLETIVGSDVRPLLVVALGDAQDPHRKALRYRSVKDVALSMGLPVVLYNSIHQPSVPRLFEALARPFVLLSIAWREIIPPRILVAARKGFNIHGGLLPEMRGGHPTQWAIIEGLAETGVTLHEMLPRVDSGNIIAIRRFPIVATDTSIEVRKKHDDAFVALCREYIHRILAGDYESYSQDETRAKRYPARTPEDGKMDLSWPYEKLERLTRALCPPYPPAFIESNGRRIPVRRIRKVDAAAKGTVFKCADAHFEIVE